MKNLIVFFDMDGVLADFDKGCVDYFGFTPNPNGKPFSGSEFNAKLQPLLNAHPDVFGKLDPMPGALRLFSEFDHSQIRILTAAPHGWKLGEARTQAAANAKQAWMREKFGFTGTFHCVEAGTKFMYRDTNPDSVSLLIDDLESNVAPWRKFGCPAILHKSMADTLSQLQLLRILYAEPEIIHLK